MGVPFPWIVIAAGVAGLVGGRFAPHRFRAGGGHGPVGKDHGSAVIGDDTPTPAHARFQPRRTLLVATIGLLLDIVPLAALALADGGSATIALMRFKAGVIPVICASAAAGLVVTLIGQEVAVQWIRRERPPVPGRPDLAVGRPLCNVARPVGDPRRRFPVARSGRVIASSPRALP